jgi:PAS domain S-box-containing protein
VLGGSRVTKLNWTSKLFACGTLIILFSIAFGYWFGSLVSCALLVVAVVCLYAGRNIFGEPQQVQQFIETVPALIWIGTPQGRLDFVNQRLLDYCGLTGDDLHHEWWRNLVHPSDRDLVARNWLRCMSNGTSYIDQYRIRRADGEYRWIESVGEPFRGINGRISHWYGLLVDIDDRRKAQEALQASENELREILDTVPGMIAVANPEGDHEYANKRSLEYTGMSFQELRSLGFISTVHPEEQPFVRGEWLRCAAAKQPFELDHRLRRYDGAYRMVHARVDPHLDAQGNIIRWYGLLTDIEDQRTAERALRASERQLRLITETIPAILTTRTATGELEYANQHFVDYTGKSVNELIQAGLALVHPDDQESFSEVRQQCIGSGRSFEVTHRLRRSDGVYRWFQSRGEPLKDSSGKVLRWYDLVIDIDESKALENALRDTQARLARASQILAVAELAASIAHEINQPLSSVVANGHACQTWLSNEPPNIERARITVERIVRDAKGAAEVVRTIRSLFKQTEPTKELLDINDLIVEVHRLIENDVAKKGVYAKLELDRDIPRIVVDRIQIQQVILNLAQNALDATISSIERPLYFVVRTRRDGNEIVVEVCDQGIGISDPDKVFEPFMTTKEDGMGMGLAISRSIIEAHDGQLWATPNIPKGATFIFTLPISAGELG